MTHPKPRLDVLIITAVRDEFNAVLQVCQGAAHNTDWTTEPGPNGRDIAFRTFQGKHGPMRVGVTYATDMGQAASTQAATAIINAYAVRCLATGRWARVAAWWVKTEGRIVRTGIFVIQPRFKQWGF